ncbi:MAG TPA: LuxR C-terminal-related transcriptional regulator, partial [Candidatus Elarobacter sp.]|nr:LuxR C-terminal-related transcriptional regulator [Candidatus Elarobacter sp.]
DVRTVKLPPTVHELLRTRVLDLSEGARHVMIVAAVAGANVRHALLRCVVGTDDDTLLSRLDELRRRGIVVDADDAGGARYDFAHPLLRDVALADAGVVRRKRLHAQIALALESTHRGDVQNHAEEIAFHLLHADDETTSREAVPYLIVAGERALARHADAEAARYLGVALQWIASDDAGAYEHAMALLARARQRTGDYASALRSWSELRDRARQRDDTRAAAAASLRLGLAHFWRGECDASLAECDAGLRETHDAALAARLHIARSASLQALARSGEARAELALAVERAAASRDVALQARAERGLLLLHVWTGPAHDARVHGARAIELATEAADRPLLWSAHWAMALLAGLTGDALGVAEHVATCSRIAGEIASPVLSLWTDEVAMEYASGIGDWDTGLAIAARAVPLARTLGQRTLLPRLLVWTAIMQTGRGDTVTAKAALDEAWSIAGADDVAAALRNPHAAIPAHTGRAAYHLARGEFADAIRIAEAGLALADRTGYAVWAIHRLLPILGETLLWVGDFERVEQLSRRMRADARRFDHRLGLAWADACDALLVLFRDRDAGRAAPLLRDAADALEAIPFPEYAARVRRQLGSALWDLGDRDGACRELRHAHEMLARMGAARELDAVRDQLREYGTRPPHRAIPADERLTGREAQIAALVAAHRTNTQIGAELGISARTVSTHLSHIFAKLGVGSRGELADVVRGLSPLQP